MKRLLQGILFALLWATSLYGQQTDYQRYDLVRKTNEVILESTAKTWMEMVNGFTLYNMNLNFQGEYTFLTHHTVMVQVPYTFAWYNNAESKNPWLYSFGDIGLSYDYLKQLGHISLFVGPQLILPLARLNEYIARDDAYNASSGRYSVGLNLEVIGVQDPVVWTGGISYQVGLPKKEQFYTTFEPGNIQLSGGFSDLFNGRFGISVDIIQYIKLAELQDGVWKQEGLMVSTLGRGEFLVLFERDYFRFSLETSLYPLNKPFVLGITYGHQFDLTRNN
jgi:hypothetical protein